MSTNVISARQINRGWHLIDATDKILGRLSSQIARILMGKNKALYVPYLDSGDYVVVINADKIKVSGKKQSQKKYVRHSGYPGGLKVELFSDVRKSRPEVVIIHAVSGMLPKNKLGRQMVKKLHVFSGNKHPYEHQFKGEKNGR